MITKGKARLPQTDGDGEVLGVVATAERAAGLGGRASGQVEPDVAAARPGRAGPGAQLGGADLDPGLGEQLGRELRIEGTGHGQHGQVLGADAPVLARHVRVQRVARLGDGAAQHAPVARADGVLVLHVGPQRVRRSVHLAALWTGPRVGRAYACQIVVPHCGEETNKRHALRAAALGSRFYNV